MFQDGFNVDDGPLRDYSSPESRMFFTFIERGQIPPELQQLARGGEVAVNIEDKRGETFQAPKQATQAFAGEGRVLGR
jgi:UBX domain-containing protein 1